MKHVKTFALFENEKALTPKQIKFLDEYTKGSWRINPATGLVDVDGDFFCSDRGLKTLLGIKFGVVGENFSCAYNQLTSLEGAPEKVGGDFSCSGNKLTSLEGAPREVGGGFSCTVNRLTSLEGAPEKVGGDFYCHQNQLTSLEGAPREVGGNFWCHQNQLTSLEGAPREVGGNFDCYEIKLTSLEGAPQRIGGNFSCYSNKLTSLEGAPREVGGNFHCSNNQLTTLKGAPQEVGGYFYLKSTLDGFKWTTGGKLEYMKENPKWTSLILPTLPYDSLLDEVSESPTLLKAVEDFDKVMYNKLLKDLGWDRMGPDLLRQLKDGIL